MKKLLALLLLTVSFNLTAQPVTGLFFDDERDGEGLMTFTNGADLIGYFYTYGESHCVEPPSSVQSKTNSHWDCDIYNQRWFFFVNTWNAKTMEATGFLYQAHGTEYPKGIPDPANPFGVIVGEAMAVGVYVLRRSGQGYAMVVAPVIGPLDPDDPLFARVFNFKTLLFAPVAIQPLP